MSDRLNPNAPVHELNFQNTGQITFISLFNNPKLQAGDWVGAYYKDQGENYNAGCGEYEGTNVFIPAQGEDWTEEGKQGFNYTETMNFFIFRDGHFYDLIPSKYTIGFHRSTSFKTSPYISWSVGAVMIHDFEIGEAIAMNTIVPEAVVSDSLITYENQRLNFKFELPRLARVQVLVYSGNKIVKSRSSYWRYIMNGWYPRLKSGSYVVVFNVKHGLTYEEDITV